MFDGIDVVTLPAADTASLRSLYVDGLGFKVADEIDVRHPLWQHVWSLPMPPSRALLLGKPNSAGGWIRLVEVPGLPEARPAGRPDRVGPYALDFYVREPDHVEERIGTAGWSFLTDAVHYPLPGTATNVRERMLSQPVSGLLHAIVQHRPRQTRCVLDSTLEEDTSEVVAVVFLTDQFDQAKAFVHGVLGGQQYFSGRFDGAEVERMLGLNPGEGFDAALFRGPRSRNARLEFAEVVPPVGPPRPVDRIPRVIAGCVVADLEALERALAGGLHGASTGILDLPDGRRALGLVSRYGATFEFWS